MHHRIARQLAAAATVLAITLPQALAAQSAGSPQSSPARTAPAPRLDLSRAFADVQDPAGAATAKVQEGFQNAVNESSAWKRLGWALLGIGGGLVTLGYYQGEQDRQKYGTSTSTDDNIMLAGGIVAIAGGLCYFTGQILSPNQAWVVRTRGGVAAGGVVRLGGSKSKRTGGR